MGSSVQATTGGGRARRSRKHDESDYMGAIRDALTACGCLLWRNNTGVATWESGARTRYGLGLGSADLVGCYRGRFVAVECKAATGRTSVAHECCGRAFTQSGGLYVLARVGSVTVQDVVRLVTQPGVGLVGLP